MIVLRDAPSGLQAFVVRRVPSMPFAPGMYVFPGGGVSAEDRSVTLPEQADPARAWLWAAADRSGAPAADVWAAAQCAVRELDEEADVRLPVTDLVLCDHWVTPQVEPRRFDVRFFACRLPDGAAARSHSTETDSGDWIASVDALARFNAGDMPMLRPTVAVFEWLSGHGSVAAALEHAGRITVRPKLPVRPDPADLQRWHLVDAETGETLVEEVQGPRHYETDGRLIEQPGRSPV